MMPTKANGLDAGATRAGELPPSARPRTRPYSLPSMAGSLAALSVADPIKSTTAANRVAPSGGSAGRHVDRRFADDRRRNCGAAEDRRRPGRGFSR